MTAIIGVDDYPSVRAALLSDLDAEILPDETIALSVYQGSAETHFLAAVAGAVPPVDLASQGAKNAVVYYTAARIAPQLALMDQEVFLEYRYHIDSSPTWEQLAELNWGRGDEEVNLLLGRKRPTPKLLSLARGRRMR